MSNCCLNCFDDSAIEGFIHDHGTSGNCDYCHSEDVLAVSTEKLGEYVRECFHNAYDNVEDIGFRFNSETGTYPVGELAEDILYREITFSDEVDRSGDFETIVFDLIRDSRPTVREVVRNCADDTMGDGGYYVEKNEFYPEENKFARSWDAFKYLVKHNRRFFDVESDWSRELLLTDLFEQFVSHSYVLTKGAEIWRARVADGDTPITPMDIERSIGAPPNTSSKHSRMSPTGIPYFYTSSDVATCLSEIKPPIGSTVWLGKFELFEDLTLFNLGAVPTIEIPSIFDPTFDGDVRWANHFFKRFYEEISSPIDQDKQDLEYIPIQILAEYIRTREFDGIRFPSSQNLNGTNYTLFYQSNDNIDGTPYYQFDSLKPSSECVMLIEFKEERISGSDFTLEPLSSRTFTETDFDRTEPEDFPTIHARLDL
jgi:hypothetical protein